MPRDPRAPSHTPPHPSDKRTVPPAALQQVYSALLDTSRRVDRLDANRTVIKPGSITGGSGGMIANGSIHAAQIEVGNVVASIMTAGQVTASHIDVTGIRATILNATSIIADGIQANILTALKAAITDLSSVSTSTGTITAQLIRTDVSPNARVEIGATAGGIKGYNASNVMTFGFDVTTGAATVGAITVTGAGTAVPASTLTGFVGGGNLLMNSSFESTDPALPALRWTGSGATFSKSSTQAFHGSNSLQVTYSSGTNPYVTTDAVANHGIPVASLRSRPLVVSAWVWVDTTATTKVASTPDTSLYVTDGTTNASAAITTLTKGQWNRVIVKFTPAAGATAVNIRLYNPYSNGPVYYDGLQLELGDAATAYAPKPDEILYGQINTAALAAGAVTASTLAVGAVTAQSISVGMTTGVPLINGQFSAGAPSAGSTLANGWTYGAGSSATVQTDARWTAVAQIVNGSAADSYMYQDVPVPAGRHVFRCWCKTASVVVGTGGGAALNVDIQSGTGVATDSPRLTGTNDWMLLEAVADMSTSGTVRVYIQLGYSGTASGTAQFANVHVLPAITGTTLTPTSIDSMTVTGAVIRTAASNPRVQMDQYGLNAWDSGGTNTFNINSSGAVSVIGSIYAKLGMSMDAWYDAYVPVANKYRILSGTNTAASWYSYVDNTSHDVVTTIDSGNGTSSFGRSQLYLISWAPNGSSGYLVSSADNTTRAIYAVADTSSKTIVTNSGLSDFVSSTTTSTMRISARNSASFTLAAGASTTINISGNLPGSATNPLPILTVAENTNVGRVTCTWSASSLGLNAVLYNPSGGSVSGTLYWRWIAE